MTAEGVFIEFSERKLRQLSQRIGVCLSKLSEDQIWARNTPNENAIGNIVLHLCGNLRQWIGHGVGGRTDVRDRDSEFNAIGGLSVTELRLRLDGAVADSIATIELLPVADLLTLIQVQKYEIPKMEAIYHAVEHFAQHTGQIIFATKLLTGEELGFYTHLRNPAHGEKTP
jgi:uncharacterized damage-inducible protein DinB